MTIEHSTQPQFLSLLTQSWLYGRVIGHLEPSATALEASHGYETPSSKLLMRWSVVASDVAGGSQTACFSCCASVSFYKVALLAMQMMAACCCGLSQLRMVAQLVKSPA